MRTYNPKTGWTYTESVQPNINVPPQSHPVLRKDRALINAYTDLQNIESLLRNYYENLARLKPSPDGSREISEDLLGELHDIYKKVNDAFISIGWNMQED